MCRTVWHITSCPFRPALSHFCAGTGQGSSQTGGAAQTGSLPEAQGNSACIYTVSALLQEAVGLAPVVLGVHYLCTTFVYPSMHVPVVWLTSLSLLTQCMTMLSVVCSEDSN